MKNCIIILFVVFSLSACKAQKVSSVNCDLCDISKVTSVYNKQKESITYEDIKMFLCTFNERCKDNTEYSEFSNEVLYGLLEKEPETIIEVLTSEKSLSSKYIYEVISNPISDVFDLRKIYSRVETVTVKGSDVKDSLLKSIKKAIDRN